MKINWDDIDDMNQSLPEGTYLCKVSSVGEGTSAKGVEYWVLTLQVMRGEKANWTIEDVLSFSEKALGRLKYVCSRLGIKTEGVGELTPDMLKGKYAYVTVEHVEEEYEKYGVKRKIKKAKVPWAGYEEVPQAELADVDLAAADVPF